MKQLKRFSVVFLLLIAVFVVRQLGLDLFGFKESERVLESDRDAIARTLGLSNDEVVVESKHSISGGIQPGFNFFRAKVLRLALLRAVTNESMNEKWTIFDKIGGKLSSLTPDDERDMIELKYLFQKTQYALNGNDSFENVNEILYRKKVISPGFTQYLAVFIIGDRRNDYQEVILSL